MPEPAVLKVTSAKEDGTYSVKDSSGNKLFDISANEESGTGIVYDNKKTPILEISVD
ncbi:MAG: hypothetical protein WA139_05320 [Candidatus Aenigmatarchaeota archaeon]